MGGYAGHEYMLFNAAVVLYEHALHNSAVISNLRSRALFHLYDSNHDKKLEVPEVAELVKDLCSARGRCATCNRGNGAAL